MDITFKLLLWAFEGNLFDLCWKQNAWYDGLDLIQKNLLEVFIPFYLTFVSMKQYAYTWTLVLVSLGKPSWLIRSPWSTNGYVCLRGSHSIALACRKIYGKQQPCYIFIFGHCISHNQPQHHFTVSLGSYNQCPRIMFPLHVWSAAAVALYAPPDSWWWPDSFFLLAQITPHSTDCHVRSV